MIKLSLKQLIFFLLISYIIFRLLLSFSYALDLGGIEENVIYTISSTFEGNPIYGNPEAENYSITQYSPILYLFNIGLDSLFGVSRSTDYHKIYVIGRILNLAVNLFSVLLLYKLLCKKMAIEKTFAFSLSVLMFFTLTRFHFSVRPDALYNLTFILFIYYSIPLIREGKGMKTFVLPCVLLVILFFIKQSAVQIIPLIPMFLLYKKRYFDFLKFSFILLFLIVLGLFLFHFFLGDYLLLNILGGIKNEISIRNAIELFLNYFSKNTIILLFFIFSMIFYLKDEISRRNILYQFIIFSTLITFFTSFILTSKVGAGINYYNEFGVLVLILFSVLFSDLNSKLLDVFLGGVLFVCVIYFFRSYYHEHSMDLKKINKHELWVNQEDFVKKVKPFLKTDSKILSFDRRIEILLPNYVIIPNKDIVPQQSPFDYSLLKNEFDNGKIEYVIQEVRSSRKKFMGLDFSEFKPILTHSNLVLLKRNNGK